MTGIETFGRVEGGESVGRIAISGGGLKANILSFGAVVQDLRLDGHDAPLVLGFDRFEDYLSYANYFGAIAGRYANRIRGGRFSIAGRRYAIEPEAPERQGLHGGSNGYARRNWTLTGHGADFVTLSLADSAGMMGFPGSLDVRCTYALKAGGTLSVKLTATTDEPTICNLAHHSYFNLDDGGSGQILDHRLMLNAGAYLPVDGELIPTGEVKPVDGTLFDFRTARPIRTEEADAQTVYDHNFCLSAARGAMRQAAWVQGAVSGVEMEVWSTEPGVQFYAGHYMEGAIPGLEGRSYGQCSGFCLEPQVWPDSPNRPYFPQALLRPGEVYRQTTEYRFRSALTG